MKHTDTFENWHEFLSACNRPVHAVNADGRAASDTRTKERKRFTGTDSFPDALQLVHGDPEREARVQSIIDSFGALSLAGEKDNTGMAMLWDVAGDDPDVARYLAGEPENMIQYVPDERIAHGKVIRIVVSLCRHCDIQAGSIERYGAAIAALVDLIEKSGRRVELAIGYNGIRSSLGIHEYRFLATVKEAQDPADFSHLVFALVNPSMTRRLIFRLMEATAIKVSGTGYGAPIDADVKLSAGTYDLFLEGNVAPAIGRTNETARAWLTETVNKITEGEL